jgi:hypothetical protein
MTQSEYNYDDLIRSSQTYKSNKDDKYKESSKDKLYKIAKKKIETTMIGALSTIEKNLGFLWGHDSQEELSPEEQHVKSVYDIIRSEILDKGNNQIRNLESEMSHYEIKWLRYHMNLPVMSMESKEESINGEAE